MNECDGLPELMVARVLTAAGPYQPEDMLSVAFVEPTVGRLVRHGDALENLAGAGIVPQTISVRVTTAARPYVVGEVLTISFVDPRIARIHASPERAPSDASPDAARVPVNMQAARLHVAPRGGCGSAVGCARTDGAGRSGSSQKPAVRITAAPRTDRRAR